MTPHVRSYSRREALTAAGALGLGAVLASCSAGAGGVAVRPESTAPTGDGASPGVTATPTTLPGVTVASDPSTAACTLTPELTEGPYYLDLDLVRRDIIDGRPGTPLELRCRVVDASCAPLSGATVDVWHADAGGSYSGVQGNAGTFLRGVQPTGADGIATFATIFPGWYPGRATHIHVKVHTGSTVHTGQLFFDEAVNDAVYATAPYTGRSGRRTRNAADRIYQGGGAATIVAVSPFGDGYAGAVTLAVET